MKGLIFFATFIFAYNSLCAQTAEEFDDLIRPNLKYIPSYSVTLGDLKKDAALYENLLKKVEDGADSPFIALKTSRELIIYYLIISKKDLSPIYAQLVQQSKISDQGKQRVIKLDSTDIGYRAISGTYYQDLKNLLTKGMETNPNGFKNPLVNRLQLNLITSLDGESISQNYFSDKKITDGFCYPVRDSIPAEVYRKTLRNIIADAIGKKEFEDLLSKETWNIIKQSNSILVIPDENDYDASILSAIHNAQTSINDPLAFDLIDASTTLQAASKKIQDKIIEDAVFNSFAAVNSDATSKIEDFIANVIDGSGTLLYDAVETKRKEECKNYTENIRGDFTHSFSLDFSSIQFSFNEFIKAIKNLPAGISLDANEEILNMLPYENQTIKAGARFLVPLSGFNGDRFNPNAQVLDARIYYRMRADFRNIFLSRMYNYDQPKLNLGEGFGAELQISSFFGLPFKFSGFWTKENYNDPVISLKNAAGSSAYFSFIQFESFFTFFKYLDDKSQHRLKMDVGLISYNIRKADYDLNNNLSAVFAKDWKTQPSLNLEYSLVLKDPMINNEPVFGISARLFEERIKSVFWISLLNFTRDLKNELRFETIYLSSPIQRGANEWENTGGTFFQLKYRYNLK